MEQQLQSFQHEKFGTVDTVIENGVVYFRGDTVGSILGYKQPHKAVIDHCVPEGKIKRATVTSGGSQLITYISEGNLYRLIVRSTVDGAQEFASWVFDTVLPTIRMHGIYANIDVIEEFLSDPEMAIRVFMALRDERNKVAQLTEDIEAMKPKEEFYDAVAGSKSAIQMADCAKVLAYPKVGRNRLFKILRELGILMDSNMPYQEYIDRGYFRTIEQKYTTSGGETRISIKTLVFQKGVDYIRKRIAEHFGASDE